MYYFYYINLDALLGKLICNEFLLAGVPTDYEGKLLLTGTETIQF
jgi:hypothetical protein